MTGALFLTVQGLADAVQVRISELEKATDYLFVRGELHGTQPAEGNIIDTFVTTNLLSEWGWIDANRLGVGTNTTALLIAPQVLGLLDMPQQLFVRMLDRASANNDMLDRDSDGSPNVYEIRNDTNPYVADFENAPKTTVAPDCDYATFTNALWTSAPYSIIQIDGEMYFNESIDLPGWPLLITGPTNRYAVIHSNADIGVFMVNRRQTDHTLIRNVYLTMDKKSSFQAGFWIGGALPWDGNAAGASFENVRLRMYNPGTWYYGWHMYGVTDTPVVINNCTISAAGATDVVPVYVYGDSQVVVTNGLNLVNMPDEGITSGYTWTGYSLLGQYESTKDSDGDGVNDYDEVFVHGTDLYMKDSDGDRITDWDEIEHGANPTNQNVYCFSLSVAVDNAFSGVGCLKLAFFEPGSNDRISDIVEVVQQHADVNLHCIATEAGKPVLRAWSASDEAFVTAPFSVKSHDNAVSISSALIQQLYDADNDDMPDIWEVANGLSPQNPDDATEDPDSDGLINLHEYWVSSNPEVYDATNTLLSVFSRSVDDLLSNGGDRSMFVDYPCESMVTSMPTSLTRNQNFFASSVDLTSVSVWNSLGNTQRCATVVSPYHIVGAAHWQVPAGQRLCFVGDDGVVYTNKVKAAKSYQYHYWNSPANTLDVAVGILEAPLPTAVHPVKILPENAMAYIGTGKKLPVLSLSQDRYAYVREISTTILPEDSERTTSISYGRPAQSPRLEYYGAVRGGDSSCPNFLLDGTTPVLLGCHLTAGGAPSIILTQSHIQRMMNELSDQYGMPRCDLEYLDLTRFQPIGGGAE